MTTTSHAVSCAQALMGRFVYCLAVVMPGI
jgi:hypothetical protein